MSCSLIEAKFQVLDRTIKMLSKSKRLRSPKVASSEQLRELVETQKPTSLLPTINAERGVGMPRSNQAHASDRSSRSQPNTAREERHAEKQRDSPPRPSTGRRDPYNNSTEFRPEQWVDPKRQRAEQLLQDTWHEIESAVNWGSSPSRELPRSKLLPESVRDNLHEREARIQDQNLNNQSYEVLDAISAAVHNALPQPKRPLTSTGLQPKKSKGQLSTRCRSAPFNSLDHQPKNWFAPSAAGNHEKKQRSPNPRRKSYQQHPAKSHTRQSKPRQCTESPSSQPHRQLSCPNSDAGESETKPPLPESKADDESFYLLELLLVHPEPLTEWRFQASFTDTSVSPAKTVILDDLTVDQDNCLLFDGPPSAPTPEPSRHFNPFLYFVGLRRPRDLYGHVLRIIVTSIRPVTRIVINTSVQFTLSPDEAAVEPPELSSRQHFEAVAKQEASLLRVLTKRNNSLSSAPRRRKGSKPRPNSKQRRPTTESNNHRASSASLARDECSPWTASEPDDLDVDGPTSMFGQMLSMQLDDSRPLSPNASPRKGPTADHVGPSPPGLPMATIDKKKMQLQRLRANIRREMSEEQIDLNL